MLDEEPPVTTIDRYQLFRLGLLVAAILAVLSFAHRYFDPDQSLAIDLAITYLIACGISYEMGHQVGFINGTQHMIDFVPKPEHDYNPFEEDWSDVDSFETIEETDDSYQNG